MGDEQVDTAVNRDGLLSIAWLVLVVICVAVVPFIWPPQMRTWSWGLLLGAGIGGSAFTIIGVLEHSRDRGFWRWSA